MRLKLFILSSYAQVLLCTIDLSLNLKQVTLVLLVALARQFKTA